MEGEEGETEIVETRGREEGGGCTNRGRKFEIGLKEEDPPCLGVIGRRGRLTWLRMPAFRVLPEAKFI